MCRKIFAILLSCCMLAGSISVSGYAADVSSEEEAIRTTEAQPLSSYQYNMGSTQSGELTETTVGNNYQFTLSSSGRVTLNFTGHMERVYLILYDGNGNEIWHSGTHYWDSSTNLNILNTSFDLTKGTYQFRVEKYSRDTGSYEFTMNFTSAEESFTEELGGNNNTLATSSNISTDTSYKGQLALNDDGDFYQFTLPSSGRASLNFTGYMHRIKLYLYDINGNEVWESGTMWWDTSSELNLVNRNFDLIKGTYRLKVERYSSDTGNYEFRINYTSAEESFTEELQNNNNSLATSSPINTSTTYKGQIGLNDDKDFYQFTVKNSGSVELYFVGYIEYLYVKIYDSSGKEVWTSGNHFWDYTSSVNLMDEMIDLSSGTYYLLIEKSGSSTGNYSFSISAEGDVPQTNPITGITVNPTSLNLAEGASASLSATISPSDTTDDKTLTWKSSNTAVASVDNNGIVTAVAEGSATITVTTSNGKSASCQVTVYREEEESSLPFADVSTGAWYYATVSEVYEKGLMTGKDDSTFAPGETLARAQFATVLYRIEGEPAITFSQTFKDVQDNIWYTDPILWAGEAGVVTGYSNGCFGPADMINREQMATMMFRYANAKGLDTSQRADFSSYPDAGSVSEFAQEAMAWCVANGIITGDNGRLNPQGETARAVCATIISRFYNAYNL